MIRSTTLTLAASVLCVSPGASRTLPAQQADSVRHEGPGKGLPMEGARALSLDTREGSWMSVDVSPDGRTVVFDLLGDLYLVPIEGGDARALTSGMPFDAQPRFSPDGRHVVFTSDRDGGQNIWLLEVATGDTTQVTTGQSNRAESPEWTPDGDYVVASMGDFRGPKRPVLRLIHRDGGRGVDLVGRTDSDDDDSEDDRTVPKALGAAFGPDDRWIWYAERTGTRDWDYNAQMPQYRLRVYDRETGESDTRVSRYGSAFRPTLSPDGRWLVYGTRHDDETGLVLRELATGEERWLAYPVQRDDQESRATMDVLPGMSFTPDSERLVASYGGRIWSVPVAGGPTREIPFRVRADIALGPEVYFDYPVEDSPTFPVRQIRDAVPSPDGTRLAFTALDRLWVANADGSDATRLTDAEISEHHPAWSPDGSSVAYVTWGPDGGHVQRVPASGGTPHRLTTVAGLYARPAWSPAADRIVVMRGLMEDFRRSSSPGAVSAADHLVWLPAEGGQLTPVLRTDDRSAPHFTTDPERIFLFAGDDGLVSVRWDGTEERRHLEVTGKRAPGAREAPSADLILMAPAGDRALAVVDRQIHVVTVPRVGGEAPTVSVARPERAAFPAKRLTDEIGGEFPAWSADGRSVHWSLGNAHFTYTLDAGGADTAYRATEVRLQVRATRDIPRGAILLRGARIVTMVGDEVLEVGDVLIEDNRIAAVGASGRLDPPEGAEVMDLSGTTIVPGLVDVHAHMWPTRSVHRPDQWLYLANLAYGVTTTRDPQTSTTDVLSYADLVRAGDIIGPRIYSTGPGVFWETQVEDLDQARELLRRYSEYFDTKTIKMYVAGNRRQRQLILMAARELGLMPTTEGSLNFKQNLSETIDGYPGLEHSIPIYPVYGDVVELFRASGRTYTPTLLVAYGGPWAENYFFQTTEVHDDAKLRRFTPHDVLDAMTLRRSQWFRREQHVFDDHARFVRDLVEAGGRAGVGSHGQLQGLGYHWELWAMASGGLSNHDALRVATVFGAEALGLDGDLGTIEPGKLADLVVMDDNPLDDLRNTNTVRLVMKNGRLYEGDTLREIWPRDRDLAPLWWWGNDPEGVPGVR